MGGAVKKVAKAAAVMASGPIGMLAGNVVADNGVESAGATLQGDSPDVKGGLNSAKPSALGKTMVNGVKGGGELVKQAAIDTGAITQPDIPNIAAEDPEAVAAADKKNRARIRRQTEVDLLTGQPGRGGTILTDQYQYQV